MSWTKRQFISAAFEQIGAANYVFDLQPEQLEAALYRLDSMMATWNFKGIRIGYPLPASPQDSSLDELTQVPDAANEAIFLNLAIRLAPTIGKSTMPETKASAKFAYDQLIATFSQPTEMLITNVPAGQGNKPWRWLFSEFIKQERKCD